MALKLEDWIVLTKKRYPKFELLDKRGSKFMKFLDGLLKVISFGQMTSFMKFTTTIGFTVYTSAEWGTFPEEKKIEVLRHERIHMQQREDLGLWFSLIYLLLPVPILFAYYRSKFEREAYEESMRTISEFRGIKALEDQDFRERMIKRFTGSGYFWCWVYRPSIEKWYDHTVAMLRIEKSSIRPPAP